uniref:Uncharacterized protein n=1 Tax=Arundo donax TaxID=35708 RepID=A0A0A9EE77_ARUDO
MSNIFPAFRLMDLRSTSRRSAYQFSSIDLLFVFSTYVSIICNFLMLGRDGKEDGILVVSG